MIKVLPCVMCFVDGVLKDRWVYLALRLHSGWHLLSCRLIGFEEIGNDDAFETATLELRLSMCGKLRT